MKSQCQCYASFHILFPTLMAPGPLTKSGRPRSSNKEASYNPSLRRDVSEPANTKVLRRATLKIDFYLIPILGMFGVFSESLSPTSTSTSQCSSPLQLFWHSW